MINCDEFQSLNIGALKQNVRAPPVGRAVQEGLLGDVAASGALSQGPAPGEISKQRTALGNGAGVRSSSERGDGERVQPGRGAGKGFGHHFKGCH